MHWHEQVLPGWEGIPPAPGESSGSTQASQRRMHGFPVASLLMKRRHASSPKPATDASTRPGCTYCLPGTTGRGSFLPNTRVTPGFVPLLHILEGRRHAPKFAGNLQPCQGFPERPCSPMGNVVLGGKELMLRAGQAGEDGDCILHAQESTKSCQAQLWDMA